MLTCLALWALLCGVAARFAEAEVLGVSVGVYLAGQGALVALVVLFALVVYRERPGDGDFDTVEERHQR